MKPLGIKVSCWPVMKLIFSKMAQTPEELNTPNLVCFTFIPLFVQ